MVRLSLFFCFVLSSALECSFAGELEDKAAKCIKDYLLNEEFGLDEYLMFADINVSSSPTSELLLQARGTMMYLHQKEHAVSYVKWNHNILDDLRAGKSQKALMAFTDTRSVLELREGESTYIVRQDNNLHKVDSQSTTDMFGDPAIILPFDWPLHSLGSFQRGDRKGLGKAYTANKVCFLEEEKGKELVSYWTVPVKAMAYIKLAFVDDLVTLKEMFWIGDETKIAEIDVTNKKHIKFESVRTKWTSFEDTSVPSEVVSIIHESPANMSTSYEVVAKFKFFSKSSPEFEKEATKSQQIARLKKVSGVIE